MPMYFDQPIRDLAKKRPGLRGLWVGVICLALSGCITPVRVDDHYQMSHEEGIVATGYAVIASQRGDTPAQQRLMAIKASKLDAYRALAEQVYGQYVNASGTMVDMSITEAQMKSRVEGVIYGATVVSITPIGEETYETRLTLSRNTIRELVYNYLQRSSIDSSGGD